MLNTLKRMLREIEDAIGYAEMCDQAYTRFYFSLCKKRKALKKTIKIFEKIERN